MLKQGSWSMIGIKCLAVFRKDHAQTRSWSAMMIQPDLIALQRQASAKIGKARLRAAAI
jgi:hypothetical protein